MSKILEYRMSTKEGDLVIILRHPVSSKSIEVTLSENFLKIRKSYPEAFAEGAMANILKGLEILLDDEENTREF